MSYLGTNEIGKMFLGDTEIAKAYLGNSLVYENTPSAPPSLLPAGYTECDWVQPTNPTGSIDTNIPQISTWELDLQCDSTPSGNQIIIARQASGPNWAAAGSSGKWAISGNASATNVTTRSLITVAFSQNYANYTVALTVNGATISKTDTQSVTNTDIKLFGYGSNYLYKGKIYGVKCTSGGSFEGIPAKRDSDGVFGIYDIEGGVFYPGTGYTGQIKTT